MLAIAGFLGGEVGVPLVGGSLTVLPNEVMVELAPVVFVDALRSTGGGTGAAVEDGGVLLLPRGIGGASSSET